MDYEKAYKEAIERCKSWMRGEHPECFTEAQKAGEFIFPELRENEDEQIKKSMSMFLINFNNGLYSRPSEEKIDSWLKWIKKQNHWKPSEEQINEVKNAIGITGTNGTVLLSLYNDLKKL